MLATVQRVLSAEVSINNQSHSSINQGVVIFICIEASDSLKEAIKMKDKIFNFRILEDDSSTMSASLKNLKEDIMIISQFTLAAITSKGTKPSFHRSAKPEYAKLMYHAFVSEFKKEQNIVVDGVFGEHMDITLTNKGPITLNFEVN